MDFQHFESEVIVDDADRTTGILRYSGELTVQDAARFKASLAEAFLKLDTCLLDVSLVRLFDLSSIQILYAAHKTALATSKRFELTQDCPSAFKNAVSDAGFDRLDWLCFGNKDRLS